MFQSVTTVHCSITLC